MDANEIRKKFLEFEVEKGHKVIAPAPLVLFTLQTFAVFLILLLLGGILIIRGKYIDITEYKENFMGASQQVIIAAHNKLYGVTHRCVFYDADACSGDQPHIQKMLPQGSFAVYFFDPYCLAYAGFL